MLIQIVIPTFGQTARTIRCMKSLRTHTDGYELIWVDNGSGKASRDEVMEEFSKHPCRRALWQSSNLGFVKGVNAGLEYALSLGSIAPFVGILNNDVELMPHWLDEMSAIAMKNDEVFAVGPVTSECVSWQSFLNVGKIVSMFEIPDGFHQMDKEHRAEKLYGVYADLFRLVNMLAFFCVIFKRPVFERVGLLDERFGIGLGDDDDLSYRMLKQGMKCALSLGTYVVHDHRSTFSALYSNEQMKAMKEDRHKVFQDKHGVEAKVFELI